MGLELRDSGLICGRITFPTKLCSVFTDCIEMMMGTKKYNISQLCCGLFIRLSRSKEEKGKEERL